MGFIGTFVGLTASFMLFIGSMIIGISSIVLAANVHWSFALLLFLIPAWMALMSQVMDWATDL